MSNDHNRGSQKKTRIINLIFGDITPQQNTDLTNLYWETRDIPSGCLSLPELLKDRLLQIRTEHMRWAYEMGELKLKNDSSLQDIFSQGEKPSMWWLSLIYERHPKLSPHLYILYKLRCLEMYMVEEGYTSLVLSGADTDIIILLRKLCENRNWKFSFIDKKRRKDSTYSLQKRLYFKIPAPIRALTRYVWWLLSIRRNLKSVKKEAAAWKNHPHTATIITYFPNIDLKAASNGRFKSRYWEKLHSILEEESRKTGSQFLHWLFIHFPSPQLSFKQCLELRNAFREKSRDGLTFNYLEEFIENKDLKNAFFHWLKLVSISLKYKKRISESCHFKNSSLNFWILIKEEWAESFRGWRCLERTLQNMAFKNYIKYAGQQRWLLFPLENCPWERMIVQAAHEAGNRIFGVQHSLIRPTDFRYFDDPRTFSNSVCSIFQPDVIGGNGDSAISQWLENGMPEERVRTLSALRYLYLSDNKADDNQITLPADPGMPVEMHEKKSLLVLTSFFEDETDAHLKLLGKTLEYGLFKNWKITIKPHPYLAVEKWLEKLPAFLEKKIVVSESPLPMLLHNRPFVWASNSTSSSVEVAIMGLPLMVMAPENSFDLCPIQNVPDLMRTACVEDVKKYLANPCSIFLPQGYLNLDTSLESWRELLGCNPDR